MRSLSDRFAYHTTDQAQQSAMAVVRERCLTAATAVARNTPEPEMSRAVDLLEQAMLVANAGIAREPAQRAHQARWVEDAHKAVALLIERGRADGIFAENCSDEQAKAIMLRGILL